MRAAVESRLTTTVYSSIGTPPSVSAVCGYSPRKVRPSPTVSSFAVPADPSASYPNISERNARAASSVASGCRRISLSRSASLCCTSSQGREEYPPPRVTGCGSCRRRVFQIRPARQALRAAQSRCLPGYPHLRRSLCLPAAALPRPFRPQTCCRGISACIFRSAKTLSAPARSPGAVEVAVPSPLPRQP